MKPFNFQTFVKESANMSSDEMEAQSDSPVADEFGKFCKECVELGVDEMLRRYSGKEVQFIIHSAMATASAGELDDLENLPMLVLAMQSKTFRDMMTSVFFFTLGMAIKEELH